MIGVVNNAVMNMGVQIYFLVSIFISFGYIPKSGIAGYILVLFFNDHPDVY